MLNRRSLCFGTSAIFAGTSLVNTKFAYAQVAEEAIARLRRDLAFILEPDIRFVPDAEFADTFLSSELSARKRFFTSISDAPTTDVQKILNPIAVEQLGINGDEDIALLSRVGDYVEGLKRDADQTVPESEHPLEIILVIVIESLGFEFMKEAIIDIVTNESVPRELADSLSQNLQFRNIEGAIENLITLISYFLSVNGLSELAKRLLGFSQREIRNRILIALGARLVPFVGQAFTAAAFTTCVYVYRERLVSAFNR